MPFLAYLYSPTVGDVLVKSMKESVVFSLGAVGLPLAMLGFNYKESLELLSPVGTRKVLLEWPGYFMLKTRIVIALSWCVVGMFVCLIGVWFVAIDRMPGLAVAIVISGILVACAATATIGLARFRVREILGA